MIDTETQDQPPSLEHLERHLVRLRSGAYSRAVKIFTPYGPLEIPEDVAAPINAAIEHALERLVRQACGRSAPRRREAARRRA